jgi:cell division transport system permease protein
MAVSARYVVRETGINLRRNLVMTLAAVLTMFVALTMLASALLMQQATKKAAIQWKGGVELSIFLQPTVSDNERDAIAHQLQGMPEVKKVRYVDKPEAYQEFKRMFANTPDLVNSLGVPDMPPSYRIVPTRAEDVQAIGDRFKNQPGVKEVVYAKEVISSLLKDFRSKQLIAFVLSFFIAIGAIVLIGTTIQLAIFARRREIGVMKLVGATNWFIRVPFMLEGLVDGIVGALLACGAAYYFRGTIASFVSNSPLVGGNSLYVTSAEALGTGLLILIVGAVGGAIVSAASVSLYLSV